MLESLGTWIARATETAAREMGIVIDFATRSPTAFATVAAVLVALVVMVALARK